MTFSVEEITKKVFPGLFYTVHMQPLWFIWRVIYLIDELAQLHNRKHNQLYSGAVLHKVRVGPERMLLWEPGLEQHAGEGSGT